MKKKYRLLFFLIGLAGCALLIIETKPSEEDWQKLLTPTLPLILLALLAIWLVIYLLHTAAYRLVLGEDTGKVSLRRMFGICVSGFALNEVTPLGLVGGEPYRIMALKNHIGTQKAASVTLTFTLLYIIGHVLLWITGILVYLLMGCPGETYMTVFLCVAMAILLAICFAFFNRSSGSLMPVLRGLAKLPLVKKPAGRLLEKYGSKLENVDSIYLAFRRETRSFKRAVLCEYLSRLLEGAEYYAIFLFFGASLSPFGGILILTMASLIGNLVFMVPMQAGTREGGMAIALEWLGIEPATGTIGGLLYRMRYIACVVIGVICILIIKDKEKQTETHGNS